jgi:hypothetical protein
MSVEKDSVGAMADTTPATPAFDALLAHAEAAAANAASLKAETRKTETPAAAPHHKDAPAEMARSAELMVFDPSAAAHDKKSSGPFRHAPLAASIALAATLGGFAGSAATLHMSRDPSPVVTNTHTTEAAEAMHDKLAQVGAEITALKTSMAAVQRNTGVQSGKLGERLDRIEKAQVEPYAKIAKLAEAVDRLERRPVPAAVQPPAPPSPEVTGSVAPEGKSEGKKETQPLYAEGWRLRDYYAGRAVVENRSGRFFEVGPGSNLPGLGRVDSIKREDGRVVVVTRNGLIGASIESRRGPAPYRY